MIRQGSHLVASKRDVYITKGIPVESEHGLAGLLTKTMDEVEQRSVLEDVIARPGGLVEGGSGQEIGGDEPSVGL